jgi:hypothetical protein
MEAQDNPKPDLDAAVESRCRRMDDMFQAFEERLVESLGRVLRESEKRTVHAFTTYTQLNEKARERRLNLPPAL